MKETVYDIMQSRLREEKASFLVTALEGPRKGEKAVYDENGERLIGQGPASFPVSEAPLHTIWMWGDERYFVQEAEKNPSVLIMGAGHISRAISELLLFIGCDATVVDDRADYLREDFFDARVTRVLLDFRTLKENLSLETYTGFVVVTRAHEYDNICLGQLRDRLSVYTGMLGSRKRIHYAFDALKAEGWSDAELANIYGPIGLDIGADTPEEIALSVVSEYLTVTRRRKAGFLSAAERAWRQAEEDK